MYDEKHFELENKLIDYIKAQIEHALDNAELKNNPELLELKENYGY